LDGTGEVENKFMNFYSNYIFITIYILVFTIVFVFWVRHWFKDYHKKRHHLPAINPQSSQIKVSFEPKKEEIFPVLPSFLKENPKSIYKNYVTCRLELSQDCPDPIHCPKCGGNLARIKHQMSKDLAEWVERDSDAPGWFLYEYKSIIIHGYTYLLVCDQCRWWYIRESYSEDSMGQSPSNVVVITYGIASDDVLITNPWEKAFAEYRIYHSDQLSPFSGEIRDMFQKAMDENPITKPYE
jgi:hypothetical protein